MKLSPGNCRKNELDMALVLAEKALRTTNGGVIFNKGTELESRLSYAQAVESMNHIRNYFAKKGSFSYSVCKSCTNWVQTPSSSFGTCKGVGGKHCYESCSNHTPNLEAWGL